MKEMRQQFYTLAIFSINFCHQNTPQARGGEGRKISIRRGKKKIKFPSA
jgi:hypothetical protein